MNGTSRYLQPRIVELERHWTFTALGIRFWDPATDSQVSDRLHVTARLEGAFSRPVSAFRTASGVYAFQGLEGLRDVEFSREGKPETGSPPAPLRHVVEVHDGGRRFVPVVFRVDLPLPFGGIFFNGGQGVLLSPPGEGPSGFYLFSDPSRRQAPGLSAVRASLQEPSSGLGAAHALLEIEVEGARWFGLADQRGEVAVLFPTPPFVRRMPASPPVSGLSSAPIAEQSWDVAVRVRYHPGAQLVLDGIGRPDLRSLIAQPPGLIRDTEAGVPVAEVIRPLVFGQELYLRTAGRSELLIEAAGSPP